MEGIAFGRRKFLRRSQKPRARLLVAFSHYYLNFNGTQLYSSPSPASLH